MFQIVTDYFYGMIGNLNLLYLDRYMYIGEIAAVLTALCWSVNSILFSDAGRKIGSQSVNHLRLWGALLLLIGQPFTIMGRLTFVNVDSNNRF